MTQDRQLKDSPTTVTQKAKASLPFSRGLLLGAVLLVGLGSMVGFWCYAYLSVGIDLSNQQGKMALPAEITVNVAATNTFDIRLDGTVNVEVPIRQKIVLPLAGSYETFIKLDTPIPVDFKVHYQGSIPVKTMAEINDTTALVLPHLPKFPLRLQVPLEFDLPVDMIIPVNTTLHFAYEGPVMLRFDQNTSTRLNTVLHTQIPLNQMMRVPLLSSFDLKIYPEAKPLGMVLDTRLQQPIKGLQIRRGAD